MSILVALSDLKHRVRARIPLAVQDAIGIHRRRKTLYQRLKAEPETLVVEQGNDRFSEGREWYRGEHANYMPSRTNLFEKDAIDNYVLKGWLPEAPFITKQHRITAFGSCFAANISRHLLERGYQVYDERSEHAATYVIRCGEGMVNSFAVAQQFQWAYGERKFDESLWYERSDREAAYDEDVRARTREVFEATDVFLITLGLAEVWYNKQSGDVFWRAIPRSKFDPERHGFKVSTVAENRKNLNTIYRTIRQRRREAAIVFTLSPVPLVATFRPVSCVTANTVSKAVLRVALDEFHRAHEDDTNLFYFPSFEIAKEHYRDPYRGDNRHIRGDVVERIMNSFAAHYLVPEA
jgi:hypothetical protein